MHRGGGGRSGLAGHHEPGMSGRPWLYTWSRNKRPCEACWIRGCTHQISVLVGQVSGRRVVILQHQRLAWEV